MELVWKKCLIAGSPRGQFVTEFIFVNYKWLGNRIYRLSGILFHGARAGAAWSHRTYRYGVYFCKLQSVTKFILQRVFRTLRSATFFLFRKKEGKMRLLQRAFACLWQACFDIHSQSDTNPLRILRLKNNFSSLALTFLYAH